MVGLRLKSESNSRGRIHVRNVSRTQKRDHHLVDVVGVKAAHEGVGVHRDGKSLGHERLDHAVDQRVRPVLLLLEDPCAVGEQWKHRAKAVS